MTDINTRTRFRLVVAEAAKMAAAELQRLLQILELLPGRDRPREAM